MYELDTKPKGPISLSGVVSPGSTVNPTIRVEGVESRSKVSLYLEDDCRGNTLGFSDVPGGATQIEITSFPLGRDGNYNYYAQQTLDTDPPYTSPCSEASVNYILDTTPSDMFSLTTQPSAQSSPKIRVEGVAYGDFVQLFTDINCTINSGSNIASREFVDIKVLPTLPFSDNYTFYARRTQSGGTGVISNCTGAAVNATFDFNTALANKWEFSEQVQKSTPNLDDLAGYAVTGTEDYLVMGVPGELSNQGRIYLWKYNGFAWTSAGSLTSSDARAGDQFGKSLDLYTYSSDGFIKNGDLLIVGAPGVNGAEGSAYIYIYSNGNWISEQKIIPSAINPGDEFGHSVAINEFVALLGLPGANGGIGSVRSYQNNARSFTVERVINPPIALNAGDRFGHGLSVHREKISISAPLNGRNSVFFYDIVANVPIYSRVLSNSSEEFGFSVDLTDNFVAIGAPAKNSDEGEAFIYNTNDWSLVQTLEAITPAAGARFGTSVSITSTVNEQGTLIASAVVGEPLNNTGQAYIFEGNNFIPKVSLPLFNNSSGDQVGQSVFIYKNNLFVGAPGAVGGNNLGTIYIYRNDL
jgi:hypothetical protein